MQEEEFPAAERIVSTIDKVLNRDQNIMTSSDKVKILILGDSGVGKTSLAYLISQSECTANPNSTIGCNIEVKLHEYKEGTQEQKTYFIELWDIGGRPCYTNTRHIFYNYVDGVILVHDLTNKKSQENLNKWLLEVINKNNDFDFSQDDFDPESFVGTSKIPILVIGTKSDLIKHSGYTRRTSSIADECGAEEVIVNSLSIKSFAAGTGDAVKLTRFFDKVIQVKHYNVQKNTSWPYRSPKYYTD